MPETITGVGTSYVNTADVPTPADLASAAGMKAAFQRVLNNAKWLYDRVTSTGVLAVRRVTDLTALAALTGMTDGQVALVDKVGLYQYVAAASDGAVANFIVVPGSGGGRWFNTTYLLRNAANGECGLNASAKVDATRVQNGVFAVGARALGMQFPTSSASVVEVTDSGFTVANMAIGDIVLLNACMEAETPADNVQAELHVGVKVNGGALSSVGFTRIAGLSGTAAFGAANVSRRYIAAASGSFEFVLAMRSMTGGQTVAMNTGSYLSAIVIRP